MTSQPTDSNQSQTSGGAESGGTHSGSASGAGGLHRVPTNGGDGGDAGSTADGTAAGAAGAESLADGGAGPVVTGQQSSGSIRQVFLGDAGAGDGSSGAGGAANFETDCRSANGEPGVQLLATVRDFKMDKIEFESDYAGAQQGLVKEALGPDRKPVFSGIASQTISGAASFDRWYRDVPGVNVPFHFQFTLEQQGGHYLSFNSSDYFPIDGLGFGNEGYPHNYSFTTEIHAKFQFNGGETFTFIGDDDVWVFVNDTLVIDLGGTHSPETQAVELDAVAEQLGMKLGQTYPIDFFHAERHTTESNFQWQTNMSFNHCMF